MLRVSLLIITLYSPTVFGFDLLTAYKTALLSDPEFIAAIKEYEASKSNKIIGLSALLPKISGSYNAATNNSKISGPAYLGGPNIITNKNYPSDNLIVQLTQPVFDLQSLAKYRKSIVDAEYAQAKLSDDTLLLLTRVFKAYAEILRSREKLLYKTSLTNESVEDFRLKRKSYDRGLVTVNEVAEAEAAWLVASANQKGALAELKANVQVLSGITSVSPSTVENLQSVSMESALPNIPHQTYDEAERAAFANNSNLSTKLLKAESAREEYNKNRAEYSPTLSVVTSWGQQNSQNTASINQNAVTSLIGLQLNVPIFSGGETYGKTSQSYSLYEKAVAEIDVAKNEIKYNLRKYGGEISSGHDVVRANHNLVLATRLSLTTMSNLRQINEATRYEHAVAERKFASAKYDFVDSKLKYIESWINYHKTMGNLSVANMELIGKFFVNNNREYK